MKKIRNFIYENYLSQIGFTKEKSYFSIKSPKKFTVIRNQNN